MNEFYTSPYHILKQVLKHEYQSVDFLGQSNSTQWTSIELAWCAKGCERHWENRDFSILFLFSRNIQSLQRYQTQTLKPTDVRYLIYKIKKWIGAIAPLLAHARAIQICLLFAMYTYLIPQ